LPWDQYLSLLKPNGTLINVGVPEKPVSFQGGPVIVNQLRVAGSLVASRHQNGKMLEFAVRHNIRPKIEEYPLVSAKKSNVKGFENDDYMTLFLT
jgi:uncharacterized zinc-type alcohol dehydrogenase-like protein